MGCVVSQPAVIRPSNFQPPAVTPTNFIAATIQIAANETKTVQDFLNHTVAKPVIQEPVDINGSIAWGKCKDRFLRFQYKDQELDAKLPPATQIKAIQHEFRLAIQRLTTDVCLEEEIVEFGFEILHDAIPVKDLLPMIATYVCGTCTKWDPTILTKKQTRYYWLMVRLQQVWYTNRELKIPDYHARYWRLVYPTKSMIEIQTFDSENEIQRLILDMQVETLVRDKKYNLALAILQRTTKACIQDFWFWTTRGEITEMLEHFEEALAYYQKGLSLSKDEGVIQRVGARIKRTRDKLDLRRKEAMKMSLSPADISAIASQVAALLQVKIIKQTASSLGTDFRVATQPNSLIENHF